MKEVKINDRIFTDKDSAIEFVEKHFDNAKNVGDLEIGSLFSYGDIKWVKLDNAHGGSLVLAVNKQADAPFDENGKNNWVTSSLRKTINAYKNARFTTFFLKDINKADLIEFERDLTTDDGMTKYGTCKDFISLYTCDEYRKYRKLIPDCGAWNWTITGDSLIFPRLVHNVGAGGTLCSSNAYSINFGIRPLCVLKSDTEIEVYD